MLKFYFNGAPNPNKIALFLEESGLPYELVPVDTRKGDQFKPEFLKVNPNGKVPAIDDNGVFVFDSNAILLYLGREDRQIPAPEHPRQPRPDAVMADVRRHRRRSLFRPGGAFQACGARRTWNTPITAISTKRIATTRSSTIISPRAATWSATPTRIVDMALWGWARLAPFVLGEDVFAKYPNVKRLVDEVSARPAATRAIALKDKFTFKADMDEEAKHIMFGHLKTKAA